MSISQIWELRLKELSEVTRPVKSWAGFQQPQSHDFSAASTMDTLHLNSESRILYQGSISRGLCMTGQSCVMRKCVSHACPSLG